MENSKTMRNKLFTVFLAAVVGAMLSYGLIVAANFAYDTWGRGPEGPMKEFAKGLGMLLAIPVAMLRREDGSPNGYLVWGVIGASVFGVAAAIWEFLIKGNGHG